MIVYGHVVVLNGMMSWLRLIPRQGSQAYVVESTPVLVPLMLERAFGDVADLALRSIETGLIHELCHQTLVEVDKLRISQFHLAIAVWLPVLKEHAVEVRAEFGMESLHCILDYLRILVVDVELALYFIVIWDERNRESSLL